MLPGATLCCNCKRPWKKGTKLAYNVKIYCICKEKRWNYPRVFCNGFKIICNSHSLLAHIREWSDDAISYGDEEGDFCVYVHAIKCCFH